jgi:hypothetical protein
VELLRLQVEDPEPPDMLLGLQPTDSPLEGDMLVERLTVLVNPLRPDTVTVKELVAPALKETVEGLAERLKSC